MAHLTNLEEVSLFRTNIGDEGLTHLKGLKKIYRLRLRDTFPTNDGMALVAQLPELV